MPDLPISTLLPTDEKQGTAWRKWVQYLGGGGLSILIAILGILMASNLYMELMSDRSEDRAALRQSDKEYRDYLIQATAKQSELQATSLEVSRQHNEILEETKDALSELSSSIEDLKTIEKENQVRLDRMLERALQNQPNQ